MATRTVRLDEESERILGEIRTATGLPVSDVLKRGLIAFQSALRADASHDPYAIYESLDVGPGGHARASARDAKRAIRVLLSRRRRHR